MGMKGEISMKGYQGVNFGQYCIIDNDVEIGAGTELGHFVHLKNGTRVGYGVQIADYCSTTGMCIIGNSVNIRTGSIISKGVIVEDCCFIGAGVITSHTKNVTHCRLDQMPRQLITRIGHGSIIGSGCVLSAGITIARGCIVGYGSIVTQDLVKPGVYFGNPLRCIRGTKPLPIAEDYKSPDLDKETMKKYLPFV
jgi:UDP-2-acetamido-3-amino-2,3-dideoxy-glucuronate N-acetyltransferase